jgi:hypothetical protein
MPVKKFKFIDKIPAPSAELRKEYTYFQLGCMACEKKTCFRIAGVARAEQAKEIVEGVSPRTVTNQGIAHSDANFDCSRNGGQLWCEQGVKIEQAIEKLNEAFVEGE